MSVMKDDGPPAGLHEHRIELSGFQIAVRVVFSCMVTAIVAIGSFLLIHYLTVR